MPLRNLVIVLLTAVVSIACYVNVQRNRYAAIVAETMQTVEKNYYEEVKPRALFEGAMNGMVQQLDPYSNFISPEEFRQFEESLEQEFGGIGIVVELNPKTNRLTVMSPLVGTPAHKAGLRSGDTILKINDTSTEEMQLKDSVTLMRGKAGTPVQLVILHAGDKEPTDYTIKRAIIPIDSVLGDRRKADGTWDFHLEQNRRIGYVRLITFGEHTVKELEKALAFPGEEVDGLILDLRDNAGGLLTSAVGTCDMFLDEGRIVSTRGRGGVIKATYDAGPGEPAFDKQIPMVVLVNGFSASASEIVAACLQDHHRAVIIGQRTWGKGTVQNVIRLEGGKSAVKLTTASYWRPSEKNIHRSKEAKEEDDWGVRPDTGFDVVLTDADARKAAKLRRERDLYPIGTSPPKEEVEPKPEEKTPGETPPGEPGAENAPALKPNEEAKPTDDAPAEPFVDPQLKRAIDYLEEQLKSPGRKQGKA